MQVVDVADREIVPAAGAVDEPRGVVLLRPFGDVDRVELAPALVERHPDDDRREVHQRVDHRLPLVRNLSADSCERSISSPLWMPSGLQGGVLVAAGHVLPDEQPSWSH